MATFRVTQLGLVLVLAACLAPFASAAVDRADCSSSQYFDQLTRVCASCDLRCAKPPKACVAHCSGPPTGRPSAALIGGLVAGMACLVLLVVLGVICRDRIGGVMRRNSPAEQTSTVAGNADETAVMIVDVPSTAVFTPVQDTQVSMAGDTSTSGSQESTIWSETPSELVVR